jgi:hypothetical protein
VFEHHRAEVDARQADVRRIEGEVPYGADREFEHLTDGLRADPGAPIPEQDLLEEGNLVVIEPRLLIPLATEPLFDAGVWGSSTS